MNAASVAMTARASLSVLYSKAFDSLKEARHITLWRRLITMILMMENTSYVISPSQGKFEAAINTAVPLWRLSLHSLENSCGSFLRYNDY